MANRNDGLTLDIEELRGDVREALEAGRPNVTLIYTNHADYKAAYTAMQADGWQVFNQRHDKRDNSRGGIVVVQLPEVQTRKLPIDKDIVARYDDVGDAKREVDERNAAVRAGEDSPYCSYALATTDERRRYAVVRTTTLFEELDPWEAA